MVAHTIDTVTSVLTQKELDLFCATYDIPANLNPKLPGRDDMIQSSPEGELGSQRIMEMKPDIWNMTLNEYLEYESEKERRSWRNVQSKSSPTRHEGADFNSSYRDKSITSDFPHYYEDAICEQDVDLEKEEVQEEDGDDGDIYDTWDITIENVERIRKFLTPNVLDEMDEVIQPLIPQPIHITPPYDDYVAPATKLILDELLEEFGDKILNVTMIDEEVDFNPTKEIEELERLLTKDPQSHFTNIQVITTRGWNSRSIRLVLCGRVVAEIQQVTV
ncbi:hypothetical protein Tco_0375024 [Tanacetum coccineum]